MKASLHNRQSNCEKKDKEVKFEKIHPILPGRQDGAPPKPSARERALSLSAPRDGGDGVRAGRGGVGVFLVRCDVADGAHAHAREQGSSQIVDGGV